MIVRARPYLDPDVIFDLANSNWSAPEDSIEHFEEIFANYIGAALVVAFHQGRDALSFALKILKIGPGDEVIVQSLMCGAVIDSILATGATVVLVDITTSDFNLDLVDLETKLSTRTRAIIVTHTFGHPADIRLIRETIRPHSATIIEDCAHTVSATVEGKRIGTVGELGFFSLNFDKPVSTGLGGILVLNDPDLAEDVREEIEGLSRTTLLEEQQILIEFLAMFMLTDEHMYRKHTPFNFFGRLLTVYPKLCADVMKAIEERDLDQLNRIIRKAARSQQWVKIWSKLQVRISPAKTFGIKRMNSLRARVGLAHLAMISDIERRRLSISEAYHDGLITAGHLTIPQYPVGRISVPLRYTVLASSAEKRVRLSRIARQNGFEIGNYNWPVPVHLNPKYMNKVKASRNTLAVSAFAAETMLQLPTHPYISDSQVMQLIDILNERARYSPTIGAIE